MKKLRGRNFCEEFHHATAIRNVTVILLLRFGGGIKAADVAGAVEDDGCVWFDADKAMVPAAEEICEDAFHLALAFSWQRVVAVFLCGIIVTVLDVDVRD